MKNSLYRINQFAFMISFICVFFDKKYALQYVYILFVNIFIVILY